MVYADNCDHMGPNAVAVDQNRVVMSEYVIDLGLATHDIVCASTTGTSLGIHYDGEVGIVSGSPLRDVVLDKACSAILLGAKLNGLDMQTILGHATVRMMLRRPLFCIFRHAYVFADSVGSERLAVWGSVKH